MATLNRSLSVDTSLVTYLMKSMASYLPISSPLLIEVWLASKHDSLFAALPILAEIQPNKLGNKKSCCCSAIARIFIRIVGCLLQQGSYAVLKSVWLHHSIVITRSILLTTVIPSFVMRGSPMGFSIATSRPIGPKVTDDARFMVLNV